MENKRAMKLEIKKHMKLKRRFDDTERLRMDKHSEMPLWARKERMDDIKIVFLCGLIIVSVAFGLNFIFDVIEEAMK